MTTKKFLPKDKDTLRQEVIKKYELDEDNDSTLINKIVEDRYKDEQFKASEKNKTAKAKEDLGKMTKGKEFYKKSEGKANAKKESLISLEDRTYLLSKGLVGNRTELRHLEKVMRITEKPWEKAISDNSFKTFKKDNDALITRRGSSLGSSRGGSTSSESSEHKAQVKKFTELLPREFKPKENKK